MLNSSGRELASAAAPAEGCTLSATLSTAVLRCKACNACKVCSMQARSASRLEEAASSQHGYVTRAQARMLDVSDVDLVRLSKRGDLKRVDHGVYKFRGAADLRWESVWVQWLRLNPDELAFHRTRKPAEVVAGRTAAWIYELGDLDPEPFEFVVDQRHQTRREGIRFRRESIARSDWEIREGLPITRPNKIVSDLLMQHVDVGHIEDIATAAFRRGILTKQELGESVKQSKGDKNFVERVIRRARS